MDLRALVRDVMPLLGDSRRVRQQMHAFRGRYRRRNLDEPLSRGVLDRIREGTRRYLDLQCDLGLMAGRDEAPVALAAAVTLYDNHLAMLPLLADKHFRRLVNQPDLGYGIPKDALWDELDRLQSKESLDRVHRLAQQWPPAVPPRDPSLETLDDAIAGSATYPLAREGTLARRLPSTIRVRRERVLDRLAELGGDAMYAVSKAFGNGIGMFEFRKGKLWKRDDVLGHLLRILKPMDLLLEKTPFRLTDFFIPGHFGHAAIWMGTAREIERLGVWDEPEMREAHLQACRPLIEEGRCVLEALRSGVELNSLKVFANVDDLAVLRPMTLNRPETVESLIRGFRQVGKAYDFNFDVESTGTIVCSELPYHVYPGVEWTTEEQLGRFTISPDDIALEAIGGNAPFDLLAFYHDGALVPPKDADRVFRELVT